MDFRQFLAVLSGELDGLRQVPGRFRVEHVREAAEQSCLISIGAGRQAELEIGAQPGTFAVALNNKSPGYWHGKAGPVSSVARLVRDAPEAVLDHWRHRFGDILKPGVVLSGLSLSVEDASPDSCFGLLSFLAIMSGIDRAEIPERWIAYVDGWERGHTAREMQPVAYGELHNALVHATVDVDIRTAWIDGLALLSACLLQGFDPKAIELESEDPAIARAAANVRFERASYENVRAALPTLQLELPLAAHPARRLLVDAVFAEERILMGAHKVYLRADRDLSFLGRGYTLNAIYRSQGQGDGFDITVSLAAASGLSIADLWEALEAAEEQAWQGKRPTSNPRRNLSGYPGGKRKSSDGTPADQDAPNEPWYHDSDFTLIAAPRRIAEGELGSKLSWSDVLDTMWRLYDPFRDKRIVATAAAMTRSRASSDGELCSIEACPSEPARGRGQRQLKMGRWYRPDNSQPPLRWSPTLGRCLAACLARSRALDTQLSVREVLDAPSHDHLLFDGGITVVSGHGAYVLANDVAGLDILEMKKAFEAAAEVMDWIDRHAGRVTELVEAVRSHMSGARTAKPTNHLKIYNAICEFQLELVELRHRLDTGTTDKPSQRFRAAIVANWGVEGRLDMLYRDLNEAKTILTAHSELVANRRIAFLTYFGFPSVLAAGLFEFIFADTPSWPPSLDGIHWWGVTGLVGLTLLGMLIMWLLSKAGDRGARIAPDADEPSRSQNGSSSSAR